MEGFLTKSSSFGFKKYRRYHRIDFNTAQIVISHTENYNGNGTQIIQFRDIVQCNKGQLEADFFLLTVSRTFELFADTDYEREMWLQGFKYVISTTKEVQKVIKDDSN